MPCGLGRRSRRLRQRVGRDRRFQVWEAVAQEGPEIGDLVTFDQSPGRRVVNCEACKFHLMSFGQVEAAATAEEEDGSCVVLAKRAIVRSGKISAKAEMAPVISTPAVKVMAWA